MDDSTNSILGFIKSRKTISAAFATVLIGIPLYFGWPGMSPDQRKSALTDATYAVAGIWGIKIIGVAMEDSAAKKAQKPDAPAQQINVGSEVSNPAPVSPAAPVLPPEPKPLTPPAPLRVAMTTEQLSAMIASAAQAGMTAGMAKAQQAALADTKVPGAT